MLVLTTVTGHTTTNLDTVGALIVHIKEGMKWSTGIWSFGYAAHVFTHFSNDLTDSAEENFGPVNADQAGNRAGFQ